MGIHIRKHTAKRGGKKITVAAHTRSGEKTKFTKKDSQALQTGQYGGGKSSFIQSVVAKAGGGLDVQIGGRNYPYPLAGKEQYEGLIAAKSTGSYYNHNIRGKYY